MSHLSLTACRVLSRRHVTSAGRIAEQALVAVLTDYGVEDFRAHEAIRAEIAHGRIRRVRGPDGAPMLEPVDRASEIRPEASARADIPDHDSGEIARPSAA